MAADKKRSWRRPYLIGGITWLCLLATLFFGYWRDGGRPMELAGAVAASFFVSLALVGMSAKGLKAWVFGTLGGAAVGIFSALDLFFGDRFERAFFVAFATLAFFIALGLILGALAELVRFLHWAVHQAAEAGTRRIRDKRRELDDLP
jgi:quinol-cytochrome oxidoreductase complex cytochrome b subunit